MDWFISFIPKNNDFAKKDEAWYRIGIESNKSWKSTKYYQVNKCRYMNYEELEAVWLNLFDSINKYFILRV